MLRKTLLVITAATISVAATAQQSQASDDITKMVCQSYKSSLVNVLRTTTEGLSDETLRKNNQPALTGNLKLQTTRDILAGLIENESSPAMKQIITKASNSYIRSQSIDSFQRGLSDLVPICVELRSAENRQQKRSFSQGAQPGTVDAPAPGNTESQRKQKSALPKIDSYL
jgi:hypothetical protein